MELVPFRRRIQHDAGTFGNAFECGFLLLGTGQDGQHGGQGKEKGIKSFHILRIY